MMLRTLLVLTLITYIQCAGHYTIVGSKQIRPNSEYHVSVSLHDETEPCDIRLSIENEKDYKISQDVTIAPYSTKIVQLTTGDMLPGSNYKLVAEGLTNIIFKNETDINLNGKKMSVLMQTDKAIYKPADTIRFRVLVLDANMKPLTITGNMLIYIMDGNTNRIKQWTNATTTKGVYSNELLLSDFPVLGDWSINVEVMGETKKKTIEVAEYVLPKFEVSIDAPAHQVYKDEKIRATIRAKYTYGKPVKGEATVTIQPTFYGGWQPVMTDLVSQKTVKIDGKGNVEFDMKADLKVTEEYQRDFEIEAVVEEELTGRKQSAKFTVTLHQSKYTIRRIGNSYTYKPGLPFEIVIKIAHHDGSPVIDKVNKLKISYGPNWDEKNYTSEEHSIDSNGMVTFTTTLPDSESGISVNGEYLGLKEGLGFFSKASSETGVYLQTNIKTEVPTINKEVSVEVQATEKMSYFTYQILGRGDVLASDTITVPDRNYHVFKFMATFSMVPKAQLIVYYLKDGEIVSEKQEIEFSEDLQNFIKLDLSTQQSKPGQDLELTVSTRPNSFVGLLGVDQSVLILKSGNDLAKSEVFDELGQYSQDYYSSNWGFGGGFYPRYYGGQGVFDDFNNAGAVVLSNAKEPVQRWPIYYSLGPGFGGGAGFAAGVGGAAQFAPGMVNSFASSSGIFKPVVPTIRKDFPETWIWDDVTDSFNGTHTLQKKVPDTITSWVITGFSVDPVTGLGLTKNPSKLEVFQPFFVSLNLPYSIKRGEVVSVPIVVFNYMEQDVNAEVTLHNEDQDFEFVEPTNEVEEAPKIELYRRKRMAVKSNDGTATSFMIKPNKVGPITIKVTATSPLAGDGIERILPCEPEGVPQYNNTAVFVDLREKSTQTENLTIVIPKNAIPDSTRIEVSVIGDILGITIKNLDSLIRMPYGCGEQNMLNFVPNIVILNYLKATDQLTPAIESKIKKFTESGYQRELTYRHKDGSFSAFGESDKNGSTWLTAFVARSFRQADGIIDVEEKIIDEALAWLSNVQADNGSFPEVGQVSHADMQGGSGQGIALTAYTLIAFLENQNKIPTYRNAINKAMDYIVKNLASLDDTYAYALASYALELAEHTDKDLILRTFDSKAKTEGDRKWWNKPIPESDAKSVWYSKPNSVNIEMTAYGLLTIMEGGSFTDGLPVMKWLLSQRNAEGGFQSTQDTVVGLQALAKFAEKISSKSNNVQVAITYGTEGAESKANVNAANSMILQQYEIPANVRNVSVTASGSGFALLQLSYKYNINVTGAWPRFTLDPMVDKISSSDYLRLTVCTAFIPAGGVNVSNMAVMEVEFPSGYTADLDRIPSIESSENVKKVETKNGDTVVIIYFDNLTTKELCPTLDAFRTHKVANQKPAPVTVYDYYDNSRQSRMFYKTQETTLCDICEGEDCGEMCKVRAEKQSSAGAAADNASASSSIRSGTASFALATLSVLVVRIMCF